MTIQEKINRLAVQQLTLEQEAKEMKPELEAFVTDESIPIGERWCYWLRALPASKNHEFGGSLDFLDENGDEISPYDDFNMERGMTKNTLDICAKWDRLIEWSERAGNDAEYDDLLKKKAHFQREFMIRNIGSFHYDW